MGQALYNNNARSTLSAGISSSATSLTLTSGGGAQFPNPISPQYFWATLVKNGNAAIFEIVLVTARSTDTVTITRGQQGTTALSWLTGDYFSQYITDGDLDNFAQVSDVQAQAGNYAVDAGTANAYSVTLSPALTAHIVGMPILWKALNNSTGASTFNDGAGAATMVAYGRSPITTQIIANQIYTCVWDGARFQLLQAPYGITEAEINNGVTPTSLLAPPGAFSRYGASITAADNSPAINNALKCNAIVYDDLENNTPNLYAIQGTIQMQFAGQQLLGRGFGDTNTGSTTAPRTTLKWTGAAGGIGISNYNGTLNLSETQLLDFLLDGNNLLNIGVQGYDQTVTSGAWRNQFKRLGIINVTYGTTAITFTGIPSSKSATLNSAWTEASGFYPVTFSDSEVRNVVLTNGLTSVNWSLPLTGSPSTSAVVNTACGLWAGDGTVNANNNDTAFEDLYINNCTIGVRNGGATLHVSRSTIAGCKAGIALTLGCIAVTDRCTFQVNNADITAYNIQSCTDFGSTSQSNATPTNVEGFYLPAIAGTFEFFGTSLQTTRADCLMDLSSMAGDWSFKGSVQSASASFNIIGLNPGYGFDCTGTNATTSGGLQFKSSGLGAFANAKFFVSLTSDQANATGDGTTVTLDASAVTVITDLNSTVGAGTGIFTAPVIGNYDFDCRIALGNLGSAHTDVFALLVVGAATYEFGPRCSPGAIRNANNEADIDGRVPCVAMSAGDTAYLSISVSGSTKTVTVFGGGPGNQYRTRFSGKLSN